MAAGAVLPVLILSAALALSPFESRLRDKMLHTLAERFNAGWKGLLSSPARINEVTLRGLAIQIPPEQKSNGRSEKLVPQKMQSVKKESYRAAVLDLAKGKESAFPFVIETVRAES